MIELSIPRRGVIQLHHLVCDVEGTLPETLLAADPGLPDTVSAFDLLTRPYRIVTSLPR